MDTDGFPLATISEKSIRDIDDAEEKTTKRGKRVQIVRNGVETISSPKLNSNSKGYQTNAAENSLHSEPSLEQNSSFYEQIRKHSPYEVDSIQDNDDADRNEQQDKLESQRQGQLANDYDGTMVSSYTTGGDNDVIEIHQFSLADVDAYLDIYFETLDIRLRRFLGQDEQLQQFRVAMKNRINTDTNAREFRNVLLGKINGEVLAAVTMIFSDDPSTISQTTNFQQRNSCCGPVCRWLTAKANYVPRDVNECYLEMIGVKNDYRRRGIGSAMLECVDYFAQQAGANSITIHVHGAELRTYFEHRGFNLSTTENSAFWKTIVERRIVAKLSKNLSIQNNNNDFTANSYLNESMVDSIDE